MNFLMPRTNMQTAASQEQQSVRAAPLEANYVSKATTTLEGLIAEQQLPENSSSETRNAESDEYGTENGSIEGSSGNSNLQVGSHVDVTEDEGFIIIPSNEVPDNWIEAPDIISFRSLNRNFVFPGEQIGILACLSAYKQDTEIITPFKVAAIMNKNGIRRSSKTENGNMGETEQVSEKLDTGASDQDSQNGDIGKNGKTDLQKDASTGESLIRMENHRRQTEQLMNKFKSSHFFARIAESDEPLWSKRRSQDVIPESSNIFEDNVTNDSSENAAKKKDTICATIDRGKFDARTSGGIARGAAKCCSLLNGDIVVILQVNVGCEFVRDPVLEILQFEKHQEKTPILPNQPTLTSLEQDPSGELLKWLLPLDNSFPSPSRPLSPPTLSTSSSIRTSSAKPTISGSSGSQLFSFGHFRSYSMSSLPPNATPSPAVVAPSAKPSFDPEDWNQFSFKKLTESGKGGNEGLLSFRGVPLEPGRFSVRCGLEGIFTPGRRWRKKIELIQPIEIQTFSVDCNTDDLLCVHVKNVSPAHVPDIVVFIDSITIVFEEASKGGPHLSLPIACIEAGNGYSLPNLELRRGEEHSFILKPATTLWRPAKINNDSNVKRSRMAAGNAASSWPPSTYIEGKQSGSAADLYTVLVSCRCNYTESKLFFKKPTSWRPRISRELMISVASEMSRQSLGSDRTQLPVQVLTLQASNMTSEDLTMTVLAPASFTSPSVLSLANSPSSPLSPFASSSELAGRVDGDGQISSSVNQGQKLENIPQPLSIYERSASIPDVPNNDKGCTHLWLQSRVPLGCVPSQSTATIKLEVLPLTDGIITLDSLRIDVKEKGLTYVPEHSLKINATSSIATGII